jgi:hypothetical protein
MFLIFNRTCFKQYHTANKYYHVTFCIVKQTKTYTPKDPRNVLDMM